MMMIISGGSLIWLFSFAKTESNPFSISGMLCQVINFQHSWRGKFERTTMS